MIHLSVSRSLPPSLLGPSGAALAIPRVWHTSRPIVRLAKPEPVAPAVRSLGCIGQTPPRVPPRPVRRRYRDRRRCRRQRCAPSGRACARCQPSFCPSPAHVAPALLRPRRRRARHRRGCRSAPLPARRCPTVGSPTRRCAACRRRSRWRARPRSGRLQEPCRKLSSIPDQRQTHSQRMFALGCWLLLLPASAGHGPIVHPMEYRKCCR